MNYSLGKLMNILLCIFLALTLSSFSVRSTESLSLAVTGHDSLFQQDNVSGVGEQVLLSHLTLDEAYGLAEKMAKVVVVKKYGHYFEKIEMKDSVTGEVKEVVSSVSAAIMKYEVVRRETRIVNGEIVAVVEIKAKYEPVELRQAMDRFYENKEVKDEVLKINKQLADVEEELFAKDLLVVELQKFKDAAGASTSRTDAQIKRDKKEIKHLRDRLNNKHLDIAKKLRLFDKAIVSLKESVTFIDGQSLVAQANKTKSKVEQLEDGYVALLKQTINSLNSSLSTSVNEDLFGEKTIVKLSPRWSLSNDLVLGPLSYPLHSVEFKHKDRSRSDGVRIQKMDIRVSPQDIVKLKYSIFFVIQVNKKTVNIPVLLPVNAPFRFNSNEACSYGNRLSKNSSEKVLCFNFEFSPRALENESTIAFDEYLTKNSLVLEFPVGQSITIKSRFEIREVSSGRAIFNKKAS
jgi:hypothetical protein